ncbi:hypothetical protein AX774_g916 [Zancudomyces culisetae]|uniref:Uncharacterized protein n=1 Tax=Zancudomyces culisetae TaxID=1213189 RepID=A0A1R1PX98_ZANCU|nr:hypothetical protein AX774_g916 [Zancudomyces culisetae]|eukprot:OMH85527.1 hypothetical protein AX774_g916 [Zancudomyces culisetae]
MIWWMRFLRRKFMIDHRLSPTPQVLLHIKPQKWGRGLTLVIKNQDRRNRVCNQDLDDIYYGRIHSCRVKFPKTANPKIGYCVLFHQFLSL